jgi:nitrate reductase NapE component
MKAKGKTKQKKKKNKKNKSKSKEKSRKKNKNNIKKKDKKENLIKSNKNKGKKNEPPKKKLNLKLKQNKNQNQNENLSGSNINDISKNSLMNKNKKMKNININIIPIKNLNYNKIKKNNIKNNNKIDSKINIHYNDKIFNAKPQNYLKQKNNILFMNYNTQELNELTYELALIYDKRTYMQYYCSLLKKKQLILFAFIPAKDYNLLTLKISLFLLSFSLYFTMNGFFFTDGTMHRIYMDKGFYNIIYEIPKILYSTAISSIINTILKYLSLSERNILSIKQEKNFKKANKKSKEVKEFIMIKFCIFFIISTTFLIFFWYFISCFCGVYINTQILLIQDTIFSFMLSMIYPFGINLIPGIFRISALRAKKKDKKCLYKFSGIVSLI